MSISKKLFAVLAFLKRLQAAKFFLSSRKDGAKVGIFPLITNYKVLKMAQKESEGFIRRIQPDSVGSLKKHAA